MKTRVISAVVLIIAVVACFAISPITRMLFILAAAILAIKEMCSALGAMALKCAKWILYVFAVGYAAAIYFSAPRIICDALFFLAVFAALTAGVTCKDIRGKGAVATLAIIAYPIIPFVLIARLSIMDNWLPVFALGCISTWLCDAFALFGGKWFGKNKLAPEVSPNKTIEGTLTGALFSVIGGVILFFVFKSTSFAMSLPLCMITALVSSSFGQIGDLAASLIKRMSGIKDYSNLIPGHGGVMDRVDSLLFSIPTAYFCLTIAGIF